MRSLQESLSQWAAVLGTALSILSLFQSRAWLTTAGLVFVSVAVLTTAYARDKQSRLKAATLAIDGRSLDSLNAANLLRRRNESLVVQKAIHVARIRKQDLEITWDYTGYCKLPKTAAIEFSIDSDNHVPFDLLQCWAYDLVSDPAGMHRIKPILTGPDGLSKKLAVPLATCLQANQPFAVRLRCNLPGAMAYGTDYYTATQSFTEVVDKLAVQLTFEDAVPVWVRVYEYENGSIRLVKSLTSQQTADGVKFCEVIDSVPGDSSRMYVFFREAQLESERAQKGKMARSV